MTEKKADLIAPLNALRFIAALAIVIFHFGRWSYPITNFVLNRYFTIANIAVSLFFVLSGFIMIVVYGHIKKYDWSEVKKFYVARIGRIVPLYLMALAVTIVYFLLINEPISKLSLVFQIFFIQAWIPHESLALNFAAWSLACEMFFYTLFPFLLWHFRNKTWNYRFLTTGIIWMVSSIAAILYTISIDGDITKADVFMKFFPLWHLNAFVIGILGGMWYREKRKINYWLILGSTLFLVIYPWLISKNVFLINHNGLLAPVFIIIILALAYLKKGTLYKILAWRPLVHAGEASYGIYILQAPVYWWVYWMYQKVHIHETLGESGRFWIYVVILIVASLLSRFTFEEKARQSIKKLLLKK